MVDKVKVNLGCGTTIAPNWINIDSSWNIWLSKLPSLKWILYKMGLLNEKAYKEKWPASVMRHDITKGLPFGDNSVDFIYTSHFLEHVEESEAAKILKECHRILKPRGWIRIVVPDAKLLAKKYVKGEIGIEEFLRYFWITASGDETPLKFLYSKDRHKWMYDFQSLAHLLRASGFKTIVRRKFREGNVPDINTLDNREGHSLYVEAEKCESKTVVS